MANFHLNPRPPKEKIFSLKTCLCHKEGVSEKDINFTAISWEMLKSAAEVRKLRLSVREFEGNLEERSIGSIPQILLF